MFEERERFPNGLPLIMKLSDLKSTTFNSTILLWGFQQKNHYTKFKSVFKGN